MSDNPVFVCSEATVRKSIWKNNSDHLFSVFVFRVCLCVCVSTRKCICDVVVGEGNSTVVSVAHGEFIAVVRIDKIQASVHDSDRPTCMSTTGYSVNEIHQLLQLSSL